MIRLASGKQNRDKSKNHCCLMRLPWVGCNQQGRDIYPGDIAIASPIRHHPCCHWLCLAFTSVQHMVQPMHYRGWESPH